jgi:hypothetical protein
MPTQECVLECGGYKIDDCFDLIFPPEMEVTGYLCMVFNCFLDDSKDQRQEKLIISAGFCGLKDEWGPLRTEWIKKLAEDGLEYFKTSEYKMLSGQFAKFKTSAYPPPTGRDNARRIRTGLQEVMARHPLIRGIGITIPVSDYNEVCALPEAQGVIYGNPYHRALESVMFETTKMINRHPGKHMVAFVHDSGPDFDELRAVYENFKINNPKTAKFLGGFIPLDDKQHPPLQAADMIANYTLSIGDKWLESDRSQLTKIEMQKNINILGVWEKHYILSVLKRNLPRHGKPIPFYLQGEDYG